MERKKTMSTSMFDEYDIFKTMHPVKLQVMKELAENSALRRKIQVSLIAGDRYVPLSIDPLCEYEP